MDLGIKGKVALVTGASRGIGKSICTSLARQGVRVVPVSRSQDLLEKLAGECALEAVIPCDLETDEGVHTLLSELDSRDIIPDIIVHNAGGNLGITDPLCSIEDWRRVMRLNLESPIQINRHLVPKLQKKKWGRICHISSVSGLENHGPPAYCAAKAALTAYVRSVGRYFARDNIILTSVLPGAIFTEGGYWDDASKNRPEHVADYLKNRMAINRFGTTDEISGLVAFLCSEHSSFCVGTALLADGGQGRVFFDQSQ